MVSAAKRFSQAVLSDSQAEAEGKVSDSQAESYDIRLDPEAQLLSAILWASDDPYGDVDVVLDYLHPNDFYRPLHRMIFQLMQEEHAKGTPLEPTILNGIVAAKGRSSEWAKWDYPRLLIELVGLSAIPAQIGYYADLVLGESYRRNFALMVVKLRQMAEQAPEEELFSELVSQGVAQRRAWQRRIGLADQLKKENNSE